MKLRVTSAVNFLLISASLRILVPGTVHLNRPHLDRYLKLILFPCTAPCFEIPRLILIKYTLKTAAFTQRKCIPDAQLTIFKFLDNITTGAEKVSLFQRDLRCMGQNDSCTER